MSDPIPVSAAPKPPDSVTSLLRDWGEGDTSALERLTPIIYDDLLRLARARLKREIRRLHTATYRVSPPLKCYVHPAAKRVGITKSLGWHSFRRTFATLLKGCGEDVKTVQELMRHASSRLTLDVYAQALTPAKRAAHLKLVGLIQPAAETAISPVWSHARDAVAVSS